MTNAQDFPHPTLCHLRDAGYKVPDCPGCIECDDSDITDASTEVHEAGQSDENYPIWPKPY